MAFHSEHVRQAVLDFDFQRLFIEELGWDHAPGNETAEVEDRSYELAAVAEKSGFVAYVCEHATVPERAERMKIERQLAKRVHEHLLLFVDHAATRQVWQWVKRQPGRSPLYREHTFHHGQTGEPLIQKLQLLAFSLDEDPSIAQVAGLAGKAFDVDRVTKRFYTRFKAEHDAFLEFVEGIPVTGDREWYTSLMLDRLMFVYFVQKKGFLDDDHNYLRNRLVMIQRRRGPDQFLSFYQHFLRRFFHEGLGKQPEVRDSEVDELIGNVPYLNGGIFDVHELERDYPEIEISDQAFDRLFNFFDDYDWHLDERPLRADNEINPDVLGYIFEKYVNQKQMGAYYTKEDITGYIAQNTVIPRLFDMARKDCAIAFGPTAAPCPAPSPPEGDAPSVIPVPSVIPANAGIQPDAPAVWRLLSENPDRYIYPAMQKGVDRELPAHVAAGLDDIAQRGRWNEPADAAHALPTETWREHVARRRRYEEVWEKLVDGEVRQINDLITLNLDIRQFAQDVILDCEGPELLRAFWKAIRAISVLDPACGSGAFLFAALNVLEPLYDACLERMEAFVAELDQSDAKRSPAKFSDFREYLSEVERHPNRRYYILKSIVIGNLYGVDIMEEAVEICKLRLFLKLAAQADTVDELEPLPDIDFNIRAGNTLVGFTSLNAVRQAMTVTPDGQRRTLFAEDQAALKRIEEEANIASAAFNQFRWQQTMFSGEVAAADKENLRRRLDNLSSELDRYLASDYGIDLGDSDACTAWRDSHKPFHWFVEFYGIMSKGGFDSVLGNPPYVEYRDVREVYSTLHLATEDCRNLYALIWERSVVLAFRGRLGMIVPVSSVCTGRYKPLRDLLASCGDLIISNFSDRPSKLFDGIQSSRLSIILLSIHTSPTSVFTTAYKKWHAVERDSLFQVLGFTNTTGLDLDHAIPKLGFPLELSIADKISKAPLVSLRPNDLADSYSIYYTRKLRYFTQILDFIPTIYDDSGALRQPTELKEIKFRDQITRNGVLSLLNSSLFYWTITIHSDCRNLNRREIEMARFGLADQSGLASLASICEELMSDIQLNSKMLTSQYQRLGALTIQTIYLRKSKSIIDEIDRILAKHYGFTDEELDFIINYDIKYRMGRER